MPLGKPPPPGGGVSGYRAVTCEFWRKPDCLPSAPVTPHLAVGARQKSKRSGFQLRNSATPQRALRSCGVAELRSWPKPAALPRQGVWFRTRLVNRDRKRRCLRIRLAQGGVVVDQFPQLFGGALLGGLPELGHRYCRRTVTAPARRAESLTQTVYSQGLAIIF